MKQEANMNIELEIEFPPIVYVFYMSNVVLKEKMTTEMSGLASV